MKCSRKWHKWRLCSRAPEGAREAPLSFLHPWMEGDEKLRHPGPSSEEGAGAVLCPLIGAEQEVAMLPCWSGERSLMPHGPFL